MTELTIYEKMILWNFQQAMKDMKDNAENVALSYALNAPINE